MRHRIATALFALLGLAAAGQAAAAPKQFILKDQSNPALIESKAALAIMAAAIPGDRMHKVYNNLRWGFATQVEGGITQSGVCVVTARVMLVPATVGKSLLFNPKSKVTVFDAVPGTSREQCSEIATAKLKEAAQSMISSILK